MTTPSLALPPAPCGRDAAALLPIGDADMPFVLRARSGDTTAYAPLWERHHRSLISYFARQLRDREEAEDLASETLLAAFDQLPAFRGADIAEENASAPSPSGSAPAPCRFQTYLFGIARHKLLHWMRRKRNRPCSGFGELEAAFEDAAESRSLEERLGAEESSDPLHALLEQEHCDAACYALADVGARSTEQFKALFLHYFCELPHKEVAALLETRSETVNTRLQEGRRTLARYYDRQEQSGTGVFC